MEILSQFPLGTILLAAGLLLAVIGAWFLVERWVNPTSARPEDPDVSARLTGVCGDTMEITLKIRDGVVASAGYWASGCGPSSACGAMATRLAVGKRVEDIPEAVHAEAIEAAVGGLPEDKVHCARLAAETLEEAVHRHLLARSRQNRERKRTAEHRASGAPERHRPR